LDSQTLLESSVSHLGDRVVLVIDDDANVLQVLERTFALAGAQVFSAASGAEALRLFYEHRPELVILDVMMPEMDGWEVCSRIRQLSMVPIIFLSALGGDEDIIRGLNCGAVGYVIKPVGPQVLLARAQAALRRTELARGTDKLAVYHDQRLTIDLTTHQVLVRGERVRLTKTEHRLLAYLLENAGQVLTLEQILEKVWGWEYRDHAQYVRIYISQLRQKLEADPKNPWYLLTEHGLGYRFRKPASTQAVRRRVGLDAAARPE
jgi:two-component system KDP operon response regulator KdpE